MSLPYNPVAYRLFGTVEPSGKAGDIILSHKETYVPDVYPIVQASLSDDDYTESTLCVRLMNKEGEIETHPLCSFSLNGTPLPNRNSLNNNQWYLIESAV